MDEKLNEQDVQTAQQTGTESESKKDDFDIKGAFDSLKESFEERFNSIEGRLAREQKREKKSQKSDSDSSHSEKIETDEFGLIELTYLKTMGVDTEDADEVNLIKKELTSQNFSKDRLPELMGYNFMKEKLENHRTAKSNDAATANLKSEAGKTLSEAKAKPDYWIKKMDSKGSFPEDLPNDRKLRAEIGRKLAEKGKSGGKKFWNE